MLASAPSVAVVPVTASGEHLAAALARLAAKGAAEGVTVEYAATGAIGTYTASSASDPSIRYCVVIDPRSKSYGCDCDGWKKHRRCKHFALALEAAGWLPEPPEPEGGAPAPRVRISLDPADIDATLQRFRDNQTLARIARAVVAERRALGLIREDAPAYDADEFPVHGDSRRPVPGDCPRCKGAAWENCSACCGSGICPTCLGDGLWHTHRDHELVTGPDGAAWICPDCAEFRDPIADADALAELDRNRMYIDEANGTVEPPDRRGRSTPDTMTSLGWSFQAAAVADREGRALDAARWRATRATDEARWLAHLRRQLAGQQSN